MTELQETSRLNYWVGGDCSLFHLDGKEIEQNALNDPDNQPLPDEFWDEAEAIFPQENVVVKG